MVVQWYPGHMVKAKRQLQEDIKLVDVVLEILDARVPESSQNPDLKEILGNKQRIIILNKEDLADPLTTKDWIDFFNKNSIKAIAVNSLRKQGIKQTLNLLNKIPVKNKIIRPIRAMVVGIPNVGKSMFINALVGKSITKTGNKPGVTRGNQWIKIKEKVQLLDTPGILWPKFEDETTGIHLAFINAVGPRAFDVEDIAFRLLKFLQQEYPENLSKRYGSECITNDYQKAINSIAFKRGYLLKGGEADYHKTSELILKDFREGKLGKISLERPQ